MFKKIQMHMRQIVVYILIALVAGTAAAYFANPKIFSFARIKNQGLSHPYNESIREDAREVFANDDALYSYVKKFGPKKTMGHLAELVPLYGDCHTTAHKAGRFAYEILNEEAFKECSSECHSGCYHGATEAYFKEHGTANLTANLNILCSNELNGFFTHQCLHGVGHGLTAWANYDLPKALKSCDMLEHGRDSCWTGVFMENIVGGLDPANGHETKYLSEDAQYPCTAMEDQYKSACYFLQTSRMMQLFHGDFKKIGGGCAKTPEQYQRTCFESMGRDVGGVYRQDPSQAIAQCKNAPVGTMRIGCLIGAAQDTFWDPSGQDLALRFCSTLTDKVEKDACYGVIFSRAPDVLISKEDRENFCKKAEATYQKMCTDIAVR